MKQLILGGARSGKSALAERLATASGYPVLYVATAEAKDTSMAQRIAHHKNRRPDSWALVEEPIHLARVLDQHAEAGRFILVDCLTLWLSNILFQENGDNFQREMDLLFDVISQLPGNQLFVSNEVGMGIVPMGEVSRRFQDESGILHQRLAEVCDRVVLTVAGLPHVLKGEPL